MENEILEIVDEFFENDRCRGYSGEVAVIIQKMTYNLPYRMLSRHKASTLYRTWIELGCLQQHLTNAKPQRSKKVFIAKTELVRNWLQETKSSDDPRSVVGENKHFDKEFGELYAKLTKFFLRSEMYRHSLMRNTLRYYMTLALTVLSIVAGMFVKNI